MLYHCSDVFCANDGVTYGYAQGHDTIYCNMGDCNKHSCCAYIAEESASGGPGGPGGTTNGAAETDGPGGSEQNNTGTLHGAAENVASSGSFCACKAFLLFAAMLATMFNAIMYHILIDR